MNSVLLTGANGFVGRAVMDRLVQSGHPVKAAVRSSGAELGGRVKRIVISGLGANTDWSVALEDIVAVIHSAARGRVMNDQTPDRLAEFRKVSVEGTLHVARQAA